MCAIPHFPVRKKSGRAFSPPCPLEFLRIARKHFPKVAFIELKQKLKIESESTGLRKFYFHMWNFIFTPSKQHLSGISNTCVAHISATITFGDKDGNWSQTAPLAPLP